MEIRHLEQILFEGGTFGKPQGSGLGIPSSQRFAKDHKGSFELQSELGLGTIAKLTLPLFSNVIESGQIRVGKTSKVIVVDDDKIIHLHWKQALKKLPNDVSYYYCVDEIPGLDPNFDYIVFSDYDFGSHKGNGCDCFLKMKSLGVVFDFYLITGTDLSLIETDVIPNIVPKPSLSLIDVRSSSDASKIILLDDEDIVHLNWKYEADLRGIEFLSFYNPADFFNQLHLITEKETPVYIDFELGGDSNGIEVAKKVSEFGFKNIVITTGHENSSVPKPDFIQGVQGKDFPSF